jgi:hypothetical protein
MTQTGTAYSGAVAANEPGTEYTILASLDGTVFQVAGNRVARDANTAIRAYLDGHDNVDSTFVAVPARSWRPVKVKTRIALEFGEAS